MNQNQLFSGSFSGKTVLVTGHTGFKGAWLSVWLKELGANVIGYALEPPTEPSLFEQCNLSKKIRSIIGDIKDLKHLQSVINETQPEIIFHLAAQPLVRESYSNPVETVSTNVLGTVHVLEAIRQKDSSVRVCQIVTSDKCYENDESNRAYGENDRMGGHDPYSASKGCAELMIAAYRKSFFSADSISKHGISLSSVRGGNVIGGGDWRSDRIIPDCIRALAQNKPILVRNPHAIRPWQYVLDCLSGYLRLAEYQMSGSDVYASAWNFGPKPTETLTVAALTEKVIKYWGCGAWIQQNNQGEQPQNFLHEASFLSLDCSKANKILAWQPVYHLDESLEETVHWYWDIQNHKNDSAYDYTVSQIQKYTQTAKERKHSWAIHEKALR